MNDKPLLSICIPTRNRAAFLYRTLRSITESPVFQNGNEVEIVISDNASTDATEEIVRIFKEKYGDKIVYSRNGENICDKNFEQVLRLGNGEFLKLNNDTFWFDENGFKKALVRIMDENPMKGEYYIQTPINEQIADGSATYEVLTSSDKWFGVTYKEDKPEVVAKFAALKADGTYPVELWG